MRLLRHDLLAASVLRVLATSTTAAATELHEPGCVANGYCERSALWILSYLARNPAVDYLVGENPYSAGGGAAISHPVNGDSFSGDHLIGESDIGLGLSESSLYQAPGFDGRITLSGSMEVDMWGEGSVVLGIDATLRVQTLVPIRLRYGMGVSETMNPPPGDLTLDSTMSINARNVTSGQEVLAISCRSVGELLIAAEAGDVI